MYITELAFLCKGNQVKNFLRTDELLEWASKGKLEIDLLFDNNSFDEMHQALKKAEELNLWRKMNLD